MDNPLCRCLYAAWSYFKVWLKQSFFYKKDFDCSYNLIQPTLICWLLQCLLLVTIKYKRNKHLIQLFIFIFASKPSFVSLQSHLKVYLLPGKVGNSTFSTQICPKTDIGLEFQKTNLRIRIRTLEILCVCLPIFKQSK